MTGRRVAMAWHQQRGKEWRLLLLLSVPIELVLAQRQQAKPAQE